MGGCVEVPRQRASEAIRLLSSQGLLDRSRKPAERRGGVLIPVSDHQSALRALGEKGIDAEECMEELPPRRPRLELEEMKKLAQDLGLWRHSYHQVGDIVVFNARNEDEIPQLRELARLYSERLPRARSFYAKLETVGETRTPRLVHLWGERRTRTVVKEHGVELAVDIARAYYNPRLAEEHHRVASMVVDGEVVVDMFAGVGGFCMHIAVLRRALVVCNDINPNAVELMLESILLNEGRMRGWIHALNLDASDLPQVLRRVKADRVIMNHPTGSLRFLGTALEISKPGATIHLYLLAPRGVVPEEMLGQEERGRFEVKRVREVLEYSPSKLIYRLDLRVAGP